MAEMLVEQRVTNLEEVMVELAQTVARTSTEVDRLSREMREFKEETRLNWARRDAEFQTYEQEWRVELQTYREQSEANLQTYQREWRAELQTYREQGEANLQAYQEKSEVDLQTYRREWRAELQALHRELNQKFGEMANKLGTLAEDLVAPSLPRILQEVVTCPTDEIISMAVRVRRPHRTEKGKSQEYDVIASCGAYALFNETKSRLRPGDVDRLLERLAQVRDYFPEYAGVKIIGSLAALYVDPSLVMHASRQGLLVLATGDELMDVLNEPGMTLREF